MLDIGEKLKTLRQEKGYSPIDLEELSGVHRTTIIRIENNTQSPSIETLLKLCNSLETSIPYFFDSEDISADMMNLIDTAKKLSPNQRQKITEMIESFITGKQ
ncbi:helix-turn-helix transcriptional regulator [Peribacillus sp. FSL K6-1552]|uniref:helix-turn-helix domain-containing protein n=1 Tax=Peribacillus sp. FSL K6-1552 TaxID=2954514 RepID=UPI0030FC5B3C